MPRDAGPTVVVTPTEQGDPGRDERHQGDDDARAHRDRHPPAAAFDVARVARGTFMREHGSHAAGRTDAPRADQLSSMLMACFGHCRTAWSHFSRRSSGGFSCRT